MWQFKDPPDVMVFTTNDILERGMCIEYVTHDEDDGAWQFHSMKGPSGDEAEARLVRLDTILSIDPSVAQIANLPEGWHAWRKGRDGIWKTAAKER